LIASKQSLTKNNEDDLAGIENRKGDKQLELRNLIAKSQVKLDEIKKNQTAEMQQYADTE
jgi:transcription initiation factor IIF auxiliary subunit